MNEWERLRRQAKQIKDNYPPGTRILLLHMGADIHRVEDGVRGTVCHVDDTGTLHCTFDNGRPLGLIYGEDSFRRLTPQELEQEQVTQEPVMEM